MLLRLLLIAALCFAQLSVSTEVDLFSLSLHELREITVASNVESDIRRQPSSVSVITGQQLKLSGARLLTHALTQFVPGYFFVDDQDDMIAGFRGLAPDNNAKVMVLINGVNMNVDWFWGANDALINSINFEWIERVEVIRGPGSVTMGQGALLGVINIVTKFGISESNQISTRVGQNDYYHSSFEHGKTGKISHYFYLARSTYAGQDMASEGWLLRDHVRDGGTKTISDQDPHLNKSDNKTLIGSIAHQSSGLEFDLIHVDQTKDLYNFYFDRDRFQEVMTTLNFSHKKNITNEVKTDTSIYYTQDDFSLFTSRGKRIGGTREVRTGGKVIVNLNSFLHPSNDLAVGFDVRHIMSGLNNASGDNYLINTVDAQSLASLGNRNNTRTWMNSNTTDQVGVFAEDFYQLSSGLTLFAALRYDDHPGWGNHLSRRVGALLTPSPKFNARLSYQNGFRGAVGMNYAGGHKEDGFLDETNFSLVEAAGFGETNPSDVKPEEIDSYELELDYQISSQYKINNVFFYNVIRNVIDVGAFLPPNWPDPEPPLPNVGDVPPGDSWGGFWYYKNNRGKIHSAGSETVFSFQLDRIEGSLSHSYVTILSANEDQKRGSMYVTENEHPKAYPENITRSHIYFNYNSRARFLLSYLYYHEWYSARGNQVDGDHLLNLGASYKNSYSLNFILSVSNILNSDNLYPMNNNPGSDDIADGTPSSETRTYWFGLEYSF